MGKKKFRLSKWYIKFPEQKLTRNMCSSTEQLYISFVIISKELDSEIICKTT